jgi:phenylalanyl-tRNA synthetase alpha chain
MLNGYPRITPIGRDALERALALRDLTDEKAGSHAMQLLLSRITEALATQWRAQQRIWRGHPVVSVADNYDRLHYPPDAVTRDARYSRYVTEDTLLRTHTTALVPAALRKIARGGARDVLLVCPGLVYRRDTIDWLHTGEPHQLDLWRITRGWLTTSDLEAMASTVVLATLPGAEYRLIASSHPYTVRGRQIDVRAGDQWIEVGECGLALPALLREAGLDEPWSGLAMGLGLDRLLMIAKGIDDVRLLRSSDPRVARQMLDLEPYRPVSDQPAIRRDLSVAIARGTSAEEIGDRVRQALDHRVSDLEAVEMLARTSYDDVPIEARRRIGMQPEHDNVLVRLVIRPLDRTLTAGEANRLRDQVYAALHEGNAWQWAASNVARSAEADDSTG